MNLIDIIFEFFYNHVWGYASGYLDNVSDYYNDKLFIGTSTSIDWTEYLSFISTIITMVVILVLCCALIKKIYNMCAHIIG